LSAYIKFIHDAAALWSHCSGVTRCVMRPEHASSNHGGPSHRNRYAKILTAGLKP